MKKTTFTLSIMLVGLLLLPSLSTATIQTSPAQDLTLKKIRDQRLYDLQNHVPVITTTATYHTYDEMTTLLQHLAITYPSIMSLSSLGKTYEGRDLWIVKLSDNVNQQENEPEVLFMGAHHGNEKPSYEVLIYFIEYMVEHYQNSSTTEAGETLNSTQIYVIPMLNPDGVEAGTRKNRSPNHGSFGFNPEVTSIGVDLNRNYGYHWYLYFLLPRLYRGSTSSRDASDVYRGERAFSENETQCVQRFVETHHITICVTYHTYGKLILYPWGYTFTPPKDASVFLSIGENISAINHYTVSSSIDLYPTLGDACDWMYGTYGILAYSIELGTEYAPNNPEVVRAMCVVHTNVNLYVCERVQIL